MRKILSSPLGGLQQLTRQATALKWGHVVKVLASPIVEIERRTRGQKWRKVFQKYNYDLKMLLHASIVRLVSLCVPEHILRHSGH